MDKREANSAVPWCPMHPRTSMPAYDRLPPKLRAVFQEAVDDWCVYCVMRDARDSAAIAEAIIQRWDAEELAERNAHRRRAIGAYAGNIPEVSPRATAAAGVAAAGQDPRRA